MGGQPAGGVPQPGKLAAIALQGSAPPPSPGNSFLISPSSRLRMPTAASATARKAGSLARPTAAARSLRLAGVMASRSTTRPPPGRSVVYMALL